MPKKWRRRQLSPPPRVSSWTTTTTTRSPRSSSNANRARRTARRSETAGVLWMAGEQKTSTIAIFRCRRTRRTNRRSQSSLLRIGSQPRPRGKIGRGGTTSMSIRSCRRRADRRRVLASFLSTKMILLILKGWVKTTVDMLLRLWLSCISLTTSQLFEKKLVWKTATR